MAPIHEVRERQARIRSVQAPTGFDSFAVIDVETTGLSHRSDRVLSIAVTTLTPTGESAEVFTSLIDPGCDPGPVHIHGITSETLRGSPTFASVRDEIARLLTGRVLVAHNAAFDYGFLASEFSRCGPDALPVYQRLCTLSLARRISLPVPNCRLDTLAAHYGVRQLRAHSADDDVRVLTEVLRGLLADSARLGVPAPILPCPNKSERNTARSAFPPRRPTPKTACRYSYPGRLEEGAALVQGMKVAISGDTVLDRNALIAMAESQGLDVTGTVSRRTSVLVANDLTTSTTKVEKARTFETRIVSETEFRYLLSNIAPGTVRPPKSSTVPNHLPPTRPHVPKGPLTGRRFLVLGGSHDAAAEIRARVSGLGGSTAVNLSASVTDVIGLPGAETLARLKKAREVGLSIHTEIPTEHEPGTRPMPVHDESLVRGQVIDLPTDELGEDWTIRAAWRTDNTWAVDIVAFILDEDQSVADDADFVFYNQPAGAGVELTVDGPSEQSINVALNSLPPSCTRVTVCASLDGADATFGDVGAIEFEVSAGRQDRILARATLDAATTERTLVLAELYLRASTWRIRAVGQGYEDDLGALARCYGVDVE